MKSTVLSCSLVAAWLALIPTLPCPAQGTAFNYNGRLTDGDLPANGNYDLTFRIYDAVANGTAASASVTNLAVGVTNGLFNVSLDFGAGVFNGDPRWLELTVRTNGNGSFTTLIPRQNLKPVPYAIFADSAKHLTGPLGTTTAQPLEFLANNQRALRLENNGGPAPNIIGGPENNSAAPGLYGTFIGSGSGNSLADEAFYSAIVGGQFNTILTNSDHSVIGGGYLNMISNLVANAVIGGGNNNIILAGGVSTIGGGWGNRIQGGWATIAGGSANVVEGDGATIAGGAGNQAKAGLASVSGGTGNVIDGAQYAAIGGGNNNKVFGNSPGSFVGAGQGNTITNAGFGVIAGGNANTITLNGGGSVISGGNGNVADANYGTIIGGEYNTVEGIGGYPTVLGGRLNRASGVASVAAGYQAVATNNGSFVWNGWNGSVLPFGSIADGEFAVKAPGGVRLLANDAAGNYGNITLDAGNGLFNLTARKGASFDLYTNSLDVSAGGVNFNTGGRGLIVDGKRLGDTGTTGSPLPDSIHITTTNTPAIEAQSTANSGGVGLLGISSSATGAAVKGVQFSSSGYAGDFAGKVRTTSSLEASSLIANGNLLVGGKIRVANAGINTGTAAFQMVVGVAPHTNTYNGFYVLDHPMLNDNTNALINLTPINREAMYLMSFTRFDAVNTGPLGQELFGINYPREIVFYADSWFASTPSVFDARPDLRGKWLMDGRHPAGGAPVSAQLPVFNVILVSP